ncbi:MAG: penicillin-binding transpeptidase domain-containing protein [Saccharofermentanales bacterium]
MKLQRHYHTDPADRKRRKKKNGGGSRKSIWVLTAFILLIPVYLTSVLFKIQVIEYDIHTQAATESHYKKQIENSKRGSIFDRNGRELAFSSTVETIGITPNDVKSRKNAKMTDDAIAAGIASALSLNKGEVLTKIRQKNKTWILLKKKVGKDESDKLKKFRKDNEIGGISIDPVDKRNYPQGTTAANLIGFTRADGIGQLGLEYQYNSQMTGEPGYTYAETDNYGQAALPFAVPISLRARDGYNIVSTIDIEIQKIIETELRNSVEIYNVEYGGVAIVMDPYTGSVLGMANTTRFDPNNPSACPAGKDPLTWDPTKKTDIDYLSKNVWRNRAISDTYEPGSTFKAITAAMAMEEGRLLENEILNDATIKVADRMISCNHVGGHGLERTEQGFWRSCNPVFVQLSQRVGLTKFYNFVRGFGLTEPTGIDLPGETAGLFHSKPTELDMACLSFGEQSTITPLAIITAYNAFANGGYLMRPQMVRSLTDSDGNLIKEIAPETVRRVISEQTATRIRSLLKGAVLYGTGLKGYVEGFSVGGKTSTSSRPDSKNDISFMSMAPVDQPEITVLVILFAPPESNAKSSLAALTSGRITSKILEYMAVPRVYTADDVSKLKMQSPIPKLTDLTFKDARIALQAVGLNIDDPSGVMGDETIVKFQWPAENVAIHKGGTIAVYSKSEPDQPMATMPDIIGKNINECMRAMTESGVNIIIDGDCLGTASSQEKAPGEKILQRSIVRVSFSAE